MRDRIYLLSLREVLQSSSPEEMLKRAYAKLDKERLHRAEQTKKVRSCAQSVGAGLLLQAAVQEAQQNGQAQTTAGTEAADGTEASAGTKTEEVILLGFSQLLERIAVPLELEYTYGKGGKPYLKSLPYYFSISHSGEYVLCVISEEEIGADIQWQEVCDIQRLGQRFFSPEERIQLRRCSSAREQTVYFYELWCRKEAWGKLTGEGIAAVIGKDLCSDAEENVQFLSIPAPENYKIAVCKRCRRIGVF